jgi:outer membrane protein TolC
MVKAGTSSYSPPQKELTMTQNPVQAENPTVQAELLRANPQLHSEDKRVEATEYQVWMENSGGYFQLDWSASVTGSYDWVGLYQNDTLPDSAYIGGDNWQWAIRGNSYKTSTPVTAGYQVRYLVWDGKAGQYVAVARGQIR